MLQSATLAELLSAPVPARTRTYSPISNKEIHETILEESQNNDFLIKSMDVRLSPSKLSTVTFYNLTDLKPLVTSSEMGIRVGFKNSYDRSCSFGFALGSVVFICTNGMVRGEYTIKKQHRMDNVAAYVKDLIHYYFTDVRSEHAENVRFANHLKSISVGEQQALTLIGHMFKDNKIMTNSQLRVMCREMYESDRFNNFNNQNSVTAWDLYNHGTEALKTCPTSNYFAKHGLYDEMFRREFK